MPTPRFLLLIALAAVLPAWAGDAARPFILWSADELASMRARAKDDPAYQALIRRNLEIEDRPTKAGGGNREMANLFRAAVLREPKAIESELKALAAFARFAMPASEPGNPNVANAAWREDRTLDALRYDALHADMPADLRTAVEARARELIAWCIATPGPWARHPQTGEPTSKVRTSWLPNMQWPTMIGAHVWAAALGDQAEIERVFNARGGWKWFFDGYIADGFYMEEFAKYYSNIGSMLWWCEGLERIGLGRYGWGYTSPSGNSMRLYLANHIRAGLPMIRDGAQSSFAIVYMGDAGRERIIGSAGGQPRWSQARMNGAIAKMRQPLWWEIGHKRFPEDGYGFFLAAGRDAGSDAWQPSLWWGIAPVPATAPPAAAPSVVSRERGFALLRADQSPAYWTSPAPAVAVQFGMYYVHYVHDPFSILDFVAGNRLLYDKAWRTGTNYAGGDAFRDHGRGQCSAVVVDDLQNQPVDDGENGCAGQRIRSDLRGPVRFAASRAAGIYPGVVYERAYLLAPEYLIDVADLVADRQRVFDWHVNAYGRLDAGSAGWTPAERLPQDELRSAGYQAHLPTLKPDEKPIARDPAGFLADLRTRSAGQGTWSETIMQEGADPVGVRVWMLGADGVETVLSAGQPPGGSPPAAGKPAPTPPVGTKLTATRVGTAARFAVVHEPLTDAKRLSGAAAWPGDADGVAIAIAGGEAHGFADIAVIRLGERADQPGTYGRDGASVTAAGNAWIRSAGGRIDAWGDVRALTLPAAGAIALTVNGAVERAEVAGGFARWSRTP